MRTHCSAIPPVLMDMLLAHQLALIHIRCMFEGRALWQANWHHLLFPQCLETSASTCSLWPGQICQLINNKVVQAAEEFEQRAAADAEAAEEDEPPLPVKGRAKLAVSRRQLARRADAPPQAQIPFSALPKVRALYLGASLPGRWCS